MSISLDKKTETAGQTMVSLMKTSNVDDLSAECIVVMDYSHSMEQPNRFYSTGIIQDAFENVLACSLAGLDDDGTVPVTFFHNELFPEEEVTKENYEGFVDKWRNGGMFGRSKRMGGTEYLPWIRKIVNLVRREVMEGKKHPRLVFIFTDGAPQDSKPQIIRELADAANLPIFWQFIGLGYEPSFLSDLDEMEVRVVDNVGLTAYDPHQEMDINAWFEMVLKEFITKWTPAARMAEIVA